MAEKLNKGKKMKKILFGIITILILSLTACGDTGSKRHKSEDNDGYYGGMSYTTGDFDQYDYMELYQSVSENLAITNDTNIRMTVFRAGDTYYGNISGLNFWTEVYANTSNLKLEDGQFAYITADIRQIYGGVGVQQINGKPIIDSVTDAEYYYVKDAINDEKFEEYDPYTESYNGPKISGNYLIFNASDEWYVYDADGFVGKYDNPEDAGEAMGLMSFGTGGSENEMSGVNMFIIKAGDLYIAYSDYAGLDSWKPLLNEDLESDFEDIAVSDGELIHISSADIYTVGKDDEKSVLITGVDGVSNCDYQAVMAAMPIDSWDEDGEYEGYGLFEYNCGEYFIVYTDGTFHVYHDDGGDVPTLVGEYDTAEEVSDMLDV